MSKVTQDYIIPLKTQCTASYALPKSSEAFNKKQLCPAQKLIADLNAIKAVMD